MMSSTEDSNNNKPKQGPNIFLIVVMIVLIAGGVWFSRDKSADAPKYTADKKGSEIQEKTLTFSELGKVLGIGKAALEKKDEGTTVVPESKIAEITQLLDETDVDKVIEVLSREGIQGVFIDPSIVQRHPIPKNSVRNRLALARPAGRLSAKLMSKELFYYTIGEPPPDLSGDAKRVLMSLARAAFAGEEGTVPENAPSIIKRTGNWTAILTVRPVQNRHVSFHSTSSDNLIDAARHLGQKARRYFLARDRFQKMFGPLDQALKNKLTLELEVLYDEGTFVGPRDNIFVWRIIEPGIHGIRMNIGGRLYFMPPWYSVATNLRTVEALFERIVSKMAGMKKSYWKDENVSFDRFRTVHWREKNPGGIVEDLYRESTKVPSMKDVTRERMIQALAGLGGWIADNQTRSDGRYMYRYYPTKDEENDEYNFVRHCLGPFSLALTQEFAPNPKNREKAEAGMRFIEEHIRWGGAPRKGNGEIDKSLESWMGKPLPGEDVAIPEFAELPNGEWSAKMGAVAVGILGYTQYKRVGWEIGPEHERVLQGLANFLLYMQNENDGSFHHYYVAPENGFYNTRNSIYPGEILYAVARLYGETKDERYRAAFKKSLKTNLDWFKGQMDKRLADGTYEEEHRKNLVQFQPWMAMAMDEMYRYDQDPEYVEASNLVSLWILETYQFDETRAFFPDYVGGYLKVLNELPAMHTFVYTEGVAASFDLARRAGEDEKVVGKLRKGAFMAARFLLQQQVRPGENDFYYPNPQKAKGAVRYCMNHNKQRIDYTYHALSAAYRILRAATDEDYAMMQKIVLPKPW